MVLRLRGLVARSRTATRTSTTATTTETVAGTIAFASVDGVSVVSLGGHSLTNAAQTFTDATGSLTASYSYDAVSGVGTISYSYTLLTNTSGDNTNVSFPVVVTDADGDNAPAVQPGDRVIVDDVPTGALRMWISVQGWCGRRRAMW